MSVSAETLAPTEAIRVSDTAEWRDADVEPRMAAEAFVLAMANAEAQAVWAYASEEDQEAFGTEAAVYHAFAETFPVLVEVVEVTVTYHCLVKQELTGSFRLPPKALLRLSLPFRTSIQVR
jgi:hypothetical protein